MKKDIVLIGAGVMSATLAFLLKEVNPDFNISIFERLPEPAIESSDAWNNAGTGHAPPGASTAVSTMIEVLQKCFTEYSDWVHKNIQQCIPSYGQSLSTNAETYQKVLQLTNNLLF